MEEEVAAEALRSAIAGVPGVASADVRLGEAAGKAEVTIRLQPDADEELVGNEVQRLLDSRGMRARLIGPASVSPPPADDGDAAVLPMTPVAPRNDIPRTTSWGRSGIRSVALEERPDSLAVVVRLDDGRTGTRRGITSQEDIDEAIVVAVAGALGQRVDAVAVEWSRFGDADVVTVVVRRGGGDLVAGAAVGGLGRSYSVALAARSALDALEG